MSRTRLRRVGRRALLACAVVAAAVGSLVPTAAPAAAQTSTAVVVVDTGSGVHQQVIQFSGTVNGIQALQLAGASPETITYGSLGEAVCKLYGFGDEPIPSRCPGGWSYYRSVGGAGAWSSSGLGASNTTVHDGDVEGWKYGGGRPAASAVFCDYVMCAPPAPDPAPSGDGQPGPNVSPPVATPSPAGSTGGAPTDSPAVAGDSQAAPGDPIAAGGETATTSTTRPSARSRTTDDRSGGETALGASKGGSDGGSGSPLGVAVVAAVLVLAAAVALVVRRRRAGPRPGTAA